MTSKSDTAAGEDRALQKKDEPTVEVVDMKLVDKACRDITAIVQKTFFKGMTEVGDYILDNFYGGDVDAARAHNPAKETSYRVLTEKCGTQAFPVSKSWLNGAVGLAIMDRMLAKQSKAYDQLSPTHKLRLLPLGEPKKVIQFAEKAIKKNLSTRALQQLVAEERANLPKSGLGRKPKNPIIKSLDRAAKTFTLDGGAKRSFRKSDVNALSDEEVSDALKSATNLMTKLQDLVNKLEERTA